MSPARIGQIIEGEIESLAFGGEGVLRHQGFVIFIPFTAIGDIISCQIIEAKQTFARASLIQIIKASVQRISPPCSYFRKCGGCQLQHLNDQGQNNYKLNSVKDALERIGHLKLPNIDFISSEIKWAYRRHITLQLKPEEKSFKIGYICQDQMTLLPVESCQIFVEKECSILKDLQQLIKKVSNASQEQGRLTLLKNKTQYILSFIFSNHFKIIRQEFLSIMDNYPLISGIIIQTPKEKITFGQIHCEEIIGDVIFGFSPETFVQNHPEQSNHIYNRIVEIASHHPHSHILDLYCGFGITSLLLAKKGYHVTGIEFNEKSIHFAKANAQKNELQTANFIRGDVEKILPDWYKNNQASLVIINPPRKGLTKQICSILLKNRPAELIYVSCMPATLARDLSILSERYKIQSCQVYDMFPQTAHIETCVYLKLINNF